MNHATCNPGSFVCPRGFTETPADDSLPQSDDEEELCLIQAPWDFDMQLLHGKKLSLLIPDIVKDSTGTERCFECTPLENASSQLTNMSALMPTYTESRKVEQRPRSFQRHFSINEVLPDFNDVFDIQDQETSDVEMPQRLRQRYLPFGAEEPVVSRKGQRKSSKNHSFESETESQKSKKRKKKSKHSEKESSDVDDDAPFPSSERLQEIKREPLAYESVISPRKRAKRSFREGNEEDPKTKKRQKKKNETLACVKTEQELIPSARWSERNSYSEHIENHKSKKRKKSSAQTLASREIKQDILQLTPVIKSERHSSSDHSDGCVSWKKQRMSEKVKLEQSSSESTRSLCSDGDRRKRRHKKSKVK